MATKHFVFQNIRILFPAILRPKNNYAGTGEEYGFVMLIPKDDKAQLLRFKKTYEELIKEEFGDKPVRIRPVYGKSIEKAVLKDGDDKYVTTDLDKRPNYEAYKGNLFCNLAVDATVGKIEAVDFDRQPIMSTDQMPSGSYGNAIVECSCYNSPKFGPQFSVRPVLVQVTDISNPIGKPTLSVDEALSMLPGAPDTANDDLPF